MAPDGLIVEPVTRTRSIAESWKNEALSLLLAMGWLTDGEVPLLVMRCEVPDWLLLSYQDSHVIAWHSDFCESLSVFFDFLDVRVFDSIS